MAESQANSGVVQWDQDREGLDGQRRRFGGQRSQRQQEGYLGLLLALFSVLAHYYYSLLNLRSAPCTSISKPVWIDAGLPDLGPRPTGRFDDASLWWRHEVLHRSVLRNYAARLRLYVNDRNALEGESLRQAPDASDRARYTAECFARADRALREWTDRVRSTPPEPISESPYVFGWSQLDEQAGMPSALERS